MKESMRAWYAQFAEKQRIGFKHNSLQFNKETKDSKTVFTRLGAKLAQKLISIMLELKPEASAELLKIDSFEFDIFTLRQHTDHNELTTILPYVLAHHGLIGSCKLDFSALMRFVRSLATGYKQIMYHN